MSYPIANDEIAPEDLRRYAKSSHSVYDSLPCIKQTYFPPKIMSQIISYLDYSYVRLVNRRTEMLRILFPVTEVQELQRQRTNGDDVYITQPQYKVHRLLWSQRWYYTVPYNRVPVPRNFDMFDLPLYDYPINFKLPLRHYKLVTVPELKQYCRDNKIKGFSKYNKRDLYTYIIKYKFD